MTMDSQSPPEIIDILGLTPLQEGLFSLHKIMQDNKQDPIYAMQVVLRMEGNWDESKLRSCIDQIMRRHPHLGAVFWDEDVEKPVQIIPGEVEMPWEVYHCTSTDITDYLVAEKNKPFDLQQPPAMRCAIIHAPSRAYLVLTVHHILMDGWSAGIFFHELITLYQGGSLPAPASYTEYINWHATKDESRTKQIWQSYLHNIEHPSKIVGSSHEHSDNIPHINTRKLSPAETDRIVGWTKKYNITPNSLIMSAWGILLSKILHTNDVCFGSTQAIRPESIQRVESLIGLCINSVPVRVRCEHTENFGQLCQRVHRESMQLREESYLSLSEIQLLSGHSELFDTLIVYENAPIGEGATQTIEVDGAQFSPEQLESFAHYPLTIVAYIFNGQLVVQFETFPHVRDIYDPDVLLDAFIEIIEQGISEENTPAVLLPSVSHPPLVTAHPSNPDISLDEYETIGELLHYHISTRPTDIAISSCAQHMTYEQLGRYIAQLSSHFTHLGITTNDTVVVMLPRTIFAVATIMAVISYTATVVPLEPGIPATRYETIVEESKPRLIITQHHDDSVPILQMTISEQGIITVPESTASESPVDTSVEKKHNGRAYIIFTSGTTGKPKGVIGTHQAVLSYAADHHHHMYRPAWEKLGRPLTIGHVWSLSFDASWQPLVSLLAGQRLHIFSEEEIRDGISIGQGIQDHQIDMLDLTPSLYMQTLAVSDESKKEEKHHTLTVLALGGEAINPQLWEQLQQRSRQDRTEIYNCYGPTETTVEVLVSGINESTTPVIGRPTAGNRAYILDQYLQPLPVGIEGELYIAGQQVCEGYLGLPAHTASRFVADPFVDGERMYRTGDRAVITADSVIAYRGRADDQVKIRGFRVELDDIHSAVMSIKEVDQAHVFTVEHPQGLRLAVAIVTDPTHKSTSSHRSCSTSQQYLDVGSTSCAQDNAIGETVSSLRSMDLAFLSRNVRARLREILPYYMVPHHIIVLDTIPVTSNGKTDVKALIRYAQQYEHSQIEEIAVPLSETGQAIIDVFSEVAGRKVQLDEHISDLGIDSIAVMSICNHAQQRGIPLSARTVIISGYIEDIIENCEKTLSSAHSTQVQLSYPLAIEPLPLAKSFTRGTRADGFTQTQLLVAAADCHVEQIAHIVRQVVYAHPMLNAQMTYTDEGQWHFTLHKAPQLKVPTAQLPMIVDESILDRYAQIEHMWHMGQQRISQMKDTLFVVVYSPHHQLVALIAHSFIIDPVSWRIVIEDFLTVGQKLTDNALSFSSYSSLEQVEPVLPPESTSYYQWSRDMYALVDIPSSQRNQLSAWYEQQYRQGVKRLFPVPEGYYGKASNCEVTYPRVPSSLANALLASSTQTLGYSPLVNMLGALALAMNSMKDSLHSALPVVALEHNGRFISDNVQTKNLDDENNEVAQKFEQAYEKIAGYDISRTVGLFTTAYPCALGDETVTLAATDAQIRHMLDVIKHTLETIPFSGSLCCYDSVIDSAYIPEWPPQILFNYLGTIPAADEIDLDPAQWNVLLEEQALNIIPVVSDRSAANIYPLTMNVVLVQGRISYIKIICKWDNTVCSQDNVDQLMNYWMQALDKVLHGVA